MEHPVASEQLATRAAQPDRRALEVATKLLCDQLSDLVALFVDAGHNLYVVGGWVRDHLLAEAMSAGSPDDLDVDLTTDALPDTTASLLERWSPTLWLAGLAFGTVGASRDGIVVEVTTHRAEQYDPNSRNPLVRFSDDINVDLSRRDFTVNAMAVALPSGDLIDPFGGADDLGARRLCTPSEPRGLFRDDPLRILRAARFVAAFNLDADPAVVAAMKAERARLAIVTAERQTTELTKLLALGSPGRGIDLLEQTGVLADVLGSPDAGPDAGPDSEPDIALDSQLGNQLNRLSPDDKTTDRTTQLALRFAALAYSTSRDTLVAEPAAELAAEPSADRAAERAAAPSTRHLRGNLRLPLEVIDLTDAILAAATSLASLDGSDPSLRRVLGSHAETYALAVDLLSVVDVALAPSTLSRLDELRRTEGAPALGKPLNGTDVMRLAAENDLTVAGPAVGEALAFVLQRHIESGPLTVAQAQGALLDYWRSSSGRAR